MRNNHKHPALTPIASALLLALSNLAHANPTGMTIISGSANAIEQGNTLTITNSNNAILNWQQFNIQANETTKFIQPSVSSSVLNRVITDNPSQILGTLTSNGSVYLINPAGILVGPNANINVGSLVASSLNITDANYLAGKQQFELAAGSIPTSVVNQGSISTPQGGQVLLVGSQVTNQGNISTPQGATILAAGSQVLITDTATPGIQVVVSVQGEGSVQNIGQILSDAGKVGIVGAAISNTGSISANSAISEGGRILLKATRTANISGIISATGEMGGKVDITAPETTLTAATITAEGNAQGGQIRVGGEYQGGKNLDSDELPNAQTLTADKNTLINVSATKTTGNGGTAILWSDKSTTSHATIKAKGGNQGQGGLIEVSSGDKLIYRGNIESSQGGQVLFDPKNITISEFQAVSVAAASVETENEDDDSNSNITTSATQITNITNTGAAVTLQANNDLTVNSAIQTAGTSSGGNITLKAGRSILLNANITTANGNLTLRANDPSATLSQRVAGAAEITMALGTTINAGTGEVDIQLSTPPTPAPTEPENITLYAITGRRILVDNFSNIPNSSTTLKDTINATDTTLGVSVHSVGSINLPLFSKIQSTGAINLSSDTADITLQLSKLSTTAGDIALTAKKITASVASVTTTSGNINLNATASGVTLSGATIINDLFNTDLGTQIQSSSGNISISGINSNGTGIYADTYTLIKTTAGGNVSLTGKSTSATNSFNGINYVGRIVGSNNSTISLTGQGSGSSSDLNLKSSDNLSFDVNTNVASINLIGNKQISATDVEGINNRTDNAQVNITWTAPKIIIDDNLSLGNDNVRLIASDNLTINSSKSISVNNLIASVGKLTNNSGATAFNTSNPWQIWSQNPTNDTVNGLAYNFKQYNAIYGSSAVLGSGNGLLYTVTPKITVNLTGNSSKIYDANRDASLTNSNIFSSGTMIGDNVSLSWSNAQFDSKNVGTAKTVSADIVISNTTDANGKLVYGYQLESNQASGTIGSITPKTLTLTGFLASDKVYDGSNIAAVVNAGALNGVINTDNVSATNSGATFSDKNVGNTKTVNLNGLSLIGEDANNYLLTDSPITSTANITKANLLVTGLSANSKAYDANTTAVLAGTATISKLGNDDVSLIGTAVGSFDNKNAGTGKSVSVTGNSISGADAANYTLVEPTNLTADVNAKTITVNYTGINKTYDGSTVAFVNGSSTGIIANDNVLFNQTALFNDRNVGIAKNIAVSNINLTGTDAHNYNLASTSATTSATINQLNSVAWTGNGNDLNWFNGANWTGRALPDANNVVNVVLPANAIVNYDSTNQQAANLMTIVGTNNSSSGVLNISGGNLSLGSTGTTGQINIATLNQSSGNISGYAAIQTSNLFTQTGGSITLSKGSLNLVTTQTNAQTMVNSISTADSININNSNGSIVNSGSATGLKAKDVNLTAQSIGTNTSPVIIDATSVVLNSTLGNIYAALSGQISSDALTIHTPTGKQQVSLIAPSFALSSSQYDDDIELKATNGDIIQTENSTIDMNGNSLSLTTLNGNILQQNNAHITNAAQAILNSAGKIDNLDISALGNVSAIAAKPMTIRYLSASVGSFSAESTGGLTTNGVISTGKTVNLTTHSPMAINGTINAGTGINLIAGSANDAASIMTINAPLYTSLGNITATAGSSILQNATMYAPNGSLNFTTPNYYLASGISNTGSVNLNGNSYITTTSTSIIDQVIAQTNKDLVKSEVTTTTASTRSSNEILTNSNQSAGGTTGEFGSDNTDNQVPNASATSKEKSNPKENTSDKTKESKQNNSEKKEESKTIKKSATCKV